MWGKGVYVRKTWQTGGILDYRVKMVNILDKPDQKELYSE